MTSRGSLQKVEHSGVLLDVTNTRFACTGFADKEPVKAEYGDLAPDYLLEPPEWLEMDEELAWSPQVRGGHDGNFSSQPDDEMMASVDDPDDSDPQCVSEYAEDIYGKLGRDANGLPQPSYMKAQPDLDAAARGTTVDWLIGVHSRYNLKTETLFLAVSILDRFLATRRVLQKNLQLVSCTAAFIAAKFEEIEPPEVRDFVHITSRACKKETILAMEVTMLTALEFCLCRPTAAHYIQRHRQESPCSEAHSSLLQYILELAMLDLRMTRFSPSLQAAAASLVSTHMLEAEPLSPAAMARPTEHTEGAVQRCAREMCVLLQDADGSFPEVRRKFSNPEFHCVATAAYMTR